MEFELPPLPYAKQALEPHMGRETLEFHYEKHHRGYLEKLEKAIGDKPEAEKGLEDIIRSSEGGVFDNAAQVWNHTFFWSSMQPGGGGEPGGEVARALSDAFGSFRSFREAFVSEGKGRFGSGWAWLVLDGDRVRCTSTPNADNPLTAGQAPLLTCDLWEHAYYLDFRNERGTYLETFVDHLIDWEFVERNLQEARR